jgi:tRNA-dihydrouridine synthase A
MIEILGRHEGGETSCLLYVSPTNDKLPGMHRNTAETPQVENAIKGGVSVEKSSDFIDRRISVAPMMEWTDRHCRYFLRGFSPDVLLYTEMITATAVLRGDQRRLLAFDPEEHPVALQLGGSEPAELAKAAAAGEAAGYCEINLNCGCPSDRVTSGAFGACLMREPARVADCVAAMRTQVRVPITVKMRIGVVERKEREALGAIVDFNQGEFDALQRFVAAIADAGCTRAIVHARKAVLGGLSPKENRAIPPLRYDVVRALKGAFPALPIVVNGGFVDIRAVLDALTWSDGVMLGREAYHHPFVLAKLHLALNPKDARPSVERGAILERMARYAERELAKGTRLAAITRHMLGLYAGEPGAREFRRILSHTAHAPGADAQLLRQAGRSFVIRPQG